MKYRDLYREGCEVLTQAGITESDLDARLLLEYVCGTNRNDLLVRGDEAVDIEKEKQYRDLLARRAERIPLQQITGIQEFMGLSFLVNENVLIPRQDTEILVEEVLKELHDGMHVLDMCTGSGCIIISLLHYTNYCKGVGVDVSAKALLIAKENANRLLGKQKEVLSVETKGVEADNTESITFVQSDLFSNVSGKFDVIVSNPPYIRSDVIETLMPEVRMHEPLLALDGSKDGLKFYKSIVDASKEYLNRGGKLYFEIGFDQAKEVSKLMELAGFTRINVVKDFAGLDRVVYGTIID